MRVNKQSKTVSVYSSYHIVVCQNKGQWCCEGSLPPWAQLWCSYLVPFLSLLRITKLWLTFCSTGREKTAEGSNHSECPCFVASSSKCFAGKIVRLSDLPLSVVLSFIFFKSSELVLDFHSGSQNTSKVIFFLEKKQKKLLFLQLYCFVCPNWSRCHSLFTESIISSLSPILTERYFDIHYLTSWRSLWILFIRTSKWEAKESWVCRWTSVRVWKTGKQKSNSYHSTFPAFSCFKMPPSPLAWN